jgi:hypothetical protein
MAEPVLLNERVMTSIALGESHFREFKSALHGLPGASSHVQKGRSKKKSAKPSWPSQTPTVANCSSG